MRISVVSALPLVLLGVLVGGGAFAAADSLITSSDIKDSSVQNRDVRKGAITMSRLAETTQELINEGGKPGPPGAPGAPGAPGTPGAPGGTAPTLTSSNFGIIYRNTNGSPVADLRFGPATPPLGAGSLSIIVRADEKVAYGVPVRGPVTDLTEVGFRVYTTGENNGRGATNLPNISFEIDPNLSSLPNKSYSTLVWNPPAQAANAWSPYIDATKVGLWGLTGFAATKEGCGLGGPLCTFAEVMKLLNDGGEAPETFTAAIAKGRDYEFQGAVDDLRLNGRVADFEEEGVFVTAP
jgi:hypothetical protein